MSKIMIKLAGLAAVFALLFGGVGGVAQATEGAAVERGPADAQQAGAPSETRAVVVSGLAFVLMVGAAGAVLWHTARSRRSTE
ncbi:hypothetical protein [Amycolatopsis pithecellobii]|uniref:LPXTG cell wall anchor domain-containing protein n=1 Tax=Amycolatopsis pithecellobii TaxID=664692 RepID=A0A6N7YMI0_9PSEU|nr:hypothetical protein [Amycolatopsis pithecellobii]MTD54187.1 hypothetical protein [Amycolatopsis pithecellobii]